MAEADIGAVGAEEDFVSWREFLTSGYSAPLALVCLAVWLHAADSLAVATMLPAIVEEIGGAAYVSWTVSLYQIGSIVAGAAGALLSLRLGLRRAMSGAALFFGAGCVLSMVSPTMPLVLVGRAMQGLGGGGLVALCFVAIGVLFPRRYAARALGAVSTFWGTSAFLGPLVGGVFVDYASWRWGFGFFAVQALALAFWIASRRDEGLGPRVAAGEAGEAAGGLADFPLRRLALLCGAVLLIAWAGVEIGAARTGGLVLAGLAALAGFLWLDGRAGSNRLFPRRPFWPGTKQGAALLTVLLFSIATVAFTAYGPMLMIGVHGVSAMAAGYIAACAAVGWSTLAILVSGLPERFDRAMIALGMGLVSLSVALFVFVVPVGPVWLVALVVFIEGAGFGMAWTFILRLGVALAPEEEIERLSGAIPTVQRLGYAMGAAVFGIAANAAGFKAMEGAQTVPPEQAAAVAWWVFAAAVPFALAGLGATWLFLRGRRAGFHG